MGYESVGLIPIRRQDRIIGLIHLADHREGKVPLELIQALEIVARTMGEAIERTQAEVALRESEERYRLLFENSRDAILLVTPDGTIKAANSAACAMFGMTEREIKSAGREGISDTTDPHFHLALKERETKGYFKGEVLLKKGDGSTFPAEISTSRFVDIQGITLISMIIRDVSERKQAEEKIRLANRKLSLMTEVASQDIQNKVTALRAFVELSKAPANEGDRKSFIEKEMLILETIHTLIKKTKDYLQMGINQSRWIPLEKIVLVQFSRISRHQKIILDNNLQGFEIYSDPVIDRVFYNLMLNAINHGKKLTRISVSWHETPEGAVLVCEDDGVGIPFGQKDHIFDRIIGGVGTFGLFFVHEFLTLSGMKIRETGTPGLGARFEILVPKGAYRFTS